VPVVPKPLRLGDTPCETAVINGLAFCRARQCPTDMTELLPRVPRVPGGSRSSPSPRCRCPMSPYRPYRADSWAVARVRHPGLARVVKNLVVLHTPRHAVFISKSTGPAYHVTRCSYRAGSCIASRWCACACAFHFYCVSCLLLPIPEAELLAPRGAHSKILLSWLS
jgi:hypothetical protein